MRRGSVVLVALLACTERNPEFCGDGTCIDPARPYCDLRGEFVDTPGTCIAVDCEPESFAFCRGEDAAVACNSTGNGYSETTCPLGCDSTNGCKECEINAQCTESRICDTSTSSCRGCRFDDECTSRVCEVASGRCVQESSIVYAAPNGTGSCSLGAPCTLSNALILAANSSSPPVIRLLPGTYTTPLDVRFPGPTEVVGTDATIVTTDDTASVSASRGAIVDIRGLTITSQRNVTCGVADTTGNVSTLMLRGATLNVLANGTAFEVERCALTVKDIELTPQGNLLATRSDATFLAERLRVHAMSSGDTSIIGAGSRVRIEFVNSLLHNVAMVTFFDDPGPPGSRALFRYTTWVTTTGLELCQGSTVSNRSVTFENSIIAASPAYDALENHNPENCSFTSTLLSRQATPPAGTHVGAPLFVDASASNFRLQSTSPALDAAQGGAPSPVEDLDGMPRPYGAAADLGAYEFRPQN